MRGIFGHLYNNIKKRGDEWYFWVTSREWADDFSGYNISKWAEFLNDAIANPNNARGAWLYFDLASGSALSCRSALRHPARQHDRNPR